MKKSLLAGILAIGIGISGCTSTGTKPDPETLVKVLQAAEKALDTLANDPAALATAEVALSELAKVAPQTGPVHQAIIDAQAALVALQKNQGTLQAVDAALEVVVSMLESKQEIPAGAVRRPAGGARVHPGATAPVTSKCCGK